MAAYTRDVSRHEYIYDIYIHIYFIRIYILEYYAGLIHPVLNDSHTINNLTFASPLADWPPFRPRVRCCFIYSYIYIIYIYVCVWTVYLISKVFYHWRRPQINPYNWSHWFHVFCLMVGKYFYFMLTFVFVKMKLITDTTLTHLPVVSHTCVSEAEQHWFK